MIQKYSQKLRIFKTELLLFYYEYVNNVYVFAINYGGME